MARLCAWTSGGWSRGSERLSGWDWVGLAVCAGLFVYLGVALLRPDKFD